MIPGRPEEARELFERAIETDPNSPNGYNQLGLMYLEKKNGMKRLDI